MGRHPEHPGSPYDIVIVVRLNSETLEVLDRLREGVPRSKYLRELMLAEDKRRLVQE